MGKSNKKAFTLIELLAVIVILAIIALIAVPVIMNIINKANKSAFKDTAYGIISAGELYFAQQQLEPLGMSKDETITLPDTTKKLELKGEVPIGSITITKEGKISLLIKNNRYCVTKDFDDKDVTITEDVANCKISNGDNTGGENTPENTLVTDITLNTTSVSIINGGTYKLEVTIEPESATNQDLTFASSNTSVATVDENGLITGITGGTTVITVSTTDGSNISKTVEVTVRQMVTSLELSASSVNLNVGESATVTTTILPENAYNKILNWVSKDTTVATVSNGTITGVSAGTTTITATTADGSNISKEINVTVTKPVDPNSLTSLATTTTEVTSIPECITNNTTCAAGTPVAIKVNESEIYNFYVISETDNKVTLIMDRNLGDNVAWYAASNNSSNGPLTAVSALKTRTSDWTNIPEREYTYSDDGGGNVYTAFKETMRARMITYTEITTLGCTGSSGSCPSWLYVNLYNTGSNTDDSGNTRYAYWTSAAISTSSHYARNVDYKGLHYLNGTADTIDGIRPVIELTK